MVNRITLLALPFPDGIDINRMVSDAGKEALEILGEDVGGYLSLKITVQVLLRPTPWYLMLPLTSIL
jgi:hypothetical protein